MKQQKITKEWIYSHYPELEVVDISTRQLQICNKNHRSSYLELELFQNFELLQGKLKMPGITFVFQRDSQDSAKKLGLVTIESMWHDDDTTEETYFCEWDVWVKQALDKLI